MQSPRFLVYANRKRLPPDYVGCYAAPSAAAALTMAGRDSYCRQLAKSPRVKLLSAVALAPDDLPDLSPRKIARPLSAVSAPR